jgi:hypothetical protein
MSNFLNNFFFCEYCTRFQALCTETAYCEWIRLTFWTILWPGVPGLRETNIVSNVKLNNSLSSNLSEDKNFICSSDNCFGTCLNWKAN